MTRKQDLDDDVLILHIKEGGPTDRIEEDGSTDDDEPGDPNGG